MSIDASLAARLGRRPVCLGVLISAILIAAAAAQGAGSTIRIEQEWELVIDEPDSVNDSPQIVCVISPLGDTTSFHAVFELNQQTAPTFAAGGLQLQLWQGETPLSEHNAGNGSCLQQANESITWTQGMTLLDGLLVFDIGEGRSTTWGTFGGHNGLVAWVRTSLANLDAYDPAVSIRNSGVNFAPNRVKSLTLKKTRFYNSDGTVREDATVRTVSIHQ